MTAASPNTPETSRLRRAIELVMFLVVLAVPLLGVWAASSLAAYWNGSRALALGVGALVFPVLPLVWEGVGELRRRRRGATGARILTLGDRMTLRTMTLSLALLVPMVALWPLPLFQALTTRGDWFLDDVEGTWVPPVRRSVLGTADGLVWLYDLSHDNPWREEGGAVETGGTGTGSAPTADEVQVAVADGTRTPDTEAPNTDTPDTDTPDTDTPNTETPNTETPSTDPAAVATSGNVPTNEGGTSPPTNEAPSASGWPWPNELHPLAHAPPASAEASIEALGDYYEQAIEDPTERAKAIHDWIADHVAYDAVGYVNGTIAPQSAEATFTTRLSVCAGYAYLFTALGRAAGLTVETVVGDARHGSGEPEGHAWNAIELDGAWALIDTTWDAGSVSGTEFTRRYRSAHFLVPPEVMGVTHLPDDPRWQLRDPPLTRGAWNRQPVLRPEFFSAGLDLIAPDRAQIDAGPSVFARVTSDRRIFLMATAEPSAGGDRTDCVVTGNATFDVRCTLPRPGTWTVRLYTSPARYGTYQGVASFEAVYR